MSLSNKLFKWLFVSLFVNVLLLVAIIYIVENNGIIINLQNEKSVVATVEDRSQTVAQYWQGLELFTTADLISALSDSTHLEYGFRCRDLALAYLVQHHHFFVNNILDSSALTEVKTDGFSFYLYNVNDSDFNKIITYAAQERYPFTILGLLELFKNDRSEQLLNAICITPEYLTFSNFFLDSLGLDKESLVDLMMYSNGEDVLDIAKFLSQEHGDKGLQSFLLRLVNGNNSYLASYLLVKIYPDYVVKNLDNDQLANVINLLGAKLPESILLEIANSPRKIDDYGKVDEEKVEEMVVHDRIYTVQKGDSLWKISRQQGVSIEDIKKHNNIKDSLLKEGMSLRLNH